VEIPNPDKKEQSAGGVTQVLTDIKLGIKAITTHKGLSYMFLFSISATFCIMPIAVLFPLLTLQHFNGGKFEMSVIEVIWGVGMLAGGGLLGAFKVQFNKIVMINSMHLLLGICLAVSGVLPVNGFI